MTRIRISNLNKVELWLLLVVITSLLFRAYVLKYLYPFPSEEILTIYKFNLWGFVVFGLLNPLLILVIGRRIFSLKVGIIAAFLYSISPWTTYLDVAGSIASLFLLGLLVGFTGILKFKRSLLFRVMLIFLGFMILLSSSDILKFTIFKNVGIINTVNQFRGEMNDSSYALLGKIVENRYVYILQYFSINFLRHFTPATYFTPENKIMGFSFSPPILFGFLFPFIIGLKSWFSLWKKYGLILFLIFLLFIPSLVSENSLSMSRLVIFSPVIFYTIGFGVDKILTTPHKYMVLLKNIFLVLIILQALVVLSDIAFREPVRIDMLRFPMLNR